MISQVITAIYEDGILRPLQRPHLTKHQIVSLIILASQRQTYINKHLVNMKRVEHAPASWKDCFATKLRWQRKGPLDLSEVSIDALWL